MSNSPFSLHPSLFRIPDPVESVLSVSPDDPDAADDPDLETEEAEA